MSAMLFGFSFAEQPKEVEPTSASPPLEPIPSGTPRVFETKEKLVKYFRAYAPGRESEMKFGSSKYLFITVFPYSGVDTGELFCFVEGSGVWLLYVRMTLVKTTSGDDIRYRQEGSFICVDRGSTTLIKINVDDAVSSNKNHIKK